MTSSTSLPSIESIVGDLQSGRLSGAEIKARARLAASALDTQAMVLLGITLGMLDRPAEAVAVHRALIAMEPLESTHHNNLGTALREAGDLDGAEEAYRQGLSLQPNDAAALSSLGSLRWQRGDAVETRELMLAAWRLDPGMPEPRIYGAPACLKCADTEMAERLLERCEEWPFLGQKLEADLGAALMQVDRADEAERRLRALLNYPEAVSVARLRLAALMERVNRLDEAESMLEGGGIDALDRREEILVRATLASRRGRYKEAIPLFRDALATGSQDIASADAWFALAKALDAVGETAEAMATLQRAHEVQLAHAGRLLPGLLAPDSNPLNILEYPVSAEAYRNWQADPAAPSAAESPIFIVGFPRSGTTLLEQMLDAHPRIRSMDERAFLQDVITAMQSRGGLRYPDDLGRLDPAALEDLRRVYWRCVQGVVTLEPGQQLLDKNPLNVLRLPLIHRIFPNARIILALRHPCDVLLSNYMQCFHAPTYQILCSSLPRLARGYAQTMDFWAAHAELFDAAILPLRHEDLLDDVETQIARLARHLDLDDSSPLYGYREHARAKGFISTPSYSQVIEPLNRKAVDRWRRYREYLEPVLPMLDAAMQRWGYDTGEQA